MSPADRLAVLRIAFDDIRPEIWRRVEVPLTTTLRALHAVIQDVMLFEDRHLFMFDIGGKRYGIPDPEWEGRLYDARNTRLGTLVDRGVSTFSYTYDFGDNWQLTVSVEHLGAADPALDYPRFVDGGRRAPPEDVGGVPGFEEFIEAMNDPAHEEHERMLQWYGRPFDQDDIALAVITDRLARLARRRAMGKATFAKSRRQLN